MGMDSKNVLLINSAYLLLLGLGMTLWTDKMCEGYGIDLSSVLSTREHWILGNLYKTTSLLQCFVGMVPVFVMAKAKAQTLKNLCFAAGILHVLNLADFFLRHKAFLDEQGVQNVNAQVVLMVILAVLCFSGADFSKPSCKLADITWGPLEIYMVLCVLMWGISCFFTPGKVLQAYKVPADNDWILHAAMWLGYNNIAIFVVEFAVLSSKDAEAKAKLVQLWSMFWACMIGSVVTYLNSATTMELDQGSMIFNAFFLLVGLFCACRAADQADKPLKM